MDDHWTWRDTGELVLLLALIGAFVVLIGLVVPPR